LPALRAGAEREMSDPMLHEITEQEMEALAKLIPANPVVTDFVLRETGPKVQSVCVGVAQAVAGMDERPNMETVMWACLLTGWWMRGRLQEIRENRASLAEIIGGEKP